ncbi:hypothetical protein BOX37_00305 [Nocardia mangyaensis]|uniref:Uncharacterized protein n=1 Tax=Nocardia mangyaensis TaxID=2213200 RepID=A0A1J0VKY8_9NOCA|nr:hypothetical protein [Nocardia mangyaensis]APE32680.1 hypothetical protein BOX37_00305 [Nocardia mangyaensis]
MAGHAAESADRHLVAKGLSATGMAGLFLLLRLFAITDYDWNAAFSVAGTIGIDDVAAMVLGTLMASPVLGGVALGILLPVAVIRQVRAGRPSWTNAGNLAWLIVVALFTASLLWTFRMWWVLGLAAAVGLALYLLSRTGKRDPEGARFARWFMSSSALIVTVAALILAASVQVPWVSLEHIHTTAGMVEGYVLENPPGYLKVLLEAGREIVIIDTADVTGRQEIEPEP